MNDKREMRKEIVHCLCGEEGLSPRFLKLLEDGGMGEYEGLLIKNEMLELTERCCVFDYKFYLRYMYQFEIIHGLKEDDAIKIIKNDFKDTISKYYVNNNHPSLRYDDEYYLNLISKQYPQSIEEAVYEAINLMDKKDIDYAKECDKSVFRTCQHFGLGLYMRNNFGINNNKAKNLFNELFKKSDGFLFMHDTMSGILLEEIWEEIQKNYDYIIENKLYKHKKYSWDLSYECEELFKSKEYDKVLVKCEEIFKLNHYHEEAIIFKTLALYYLNNHKAAINVINEAINDFDNYKFYYIKTFMLSDLNRDDEALTCLDICLEKNPKNIYIINKKIELLINMNKFDELYEFYKTLEDNIVLNGLKIQLLAFGFAKNKMYDEAIECYNRVLKFKIKNYSQVDYDYDDFNLLDEIKKDFIELGLDLKKIYPNGLYLDWIDNYSFEKPTGKCPICGGEIIPVYYDNYPDDELIKKAEKDEAIIKQNVIEDEDPFTCKDIYYCPNCKKDLDLGINGLHADAKNYLQEKYALDKIGPIYLCVYQDKVSIDDLKEELDYFDECELNYFIKKLKDINYLIEVDKGIFKYSWR